MKGDRYTSWKVLTVIPVYTTLRSFLLLFDFLHDLVQQVVQKFVGVLMHR